MSDTPATPSASVETKGHAVIARSPSKLLDDREFKALAEGIDKASDGNPNLSVVVLDLSAVRIVPSLALGLLVQLSKRCKSRGQKLLLAAVQPQVRQVFTVTQLDRVFAFAPSVDAAVGSVAGEGTP
jgi:anti-sigma B factor antagonist